MKVTRLFVLMAVGLLASVAPAAAVQFVCPSLMVDPCELTIVEPGGSAGVGIYVHGGSNGADVTIVVASGSIAGFQAASDLVKFHPVDFGPPPIQQIRIAGVRDVPSDPPDPLIPFYLGTLTVDVDTSSASASVAVAAGTSVGEGDELQVISAENIATIMAPEPAEWLLLGAGVLTLAALRRAAPRVSA
jgi:hypothetical protein